FPFDNFRNSSTLFSQLCVSFSRCTCALLVSHQYLALDGITTQFELQAQATQLIESLNPRHNVGGRKECHDPWLCVLAIS
ncbi:hypothetical protein ACHAW6_016140, partial [Cyclotella cf. meneghiniana]